MVINNMEKLHQLKKALLWAEKHEPSSVAPLNIRLKKLSAIIKNYTYEQKTNRPPTQEND